MSLKHIPNILPKFQAKILEPNLKSSRTAKIANILSIKNQINFDLNLGFLFPKWRKMMDRSRTWSGKHKVNRSPNPTGTPTVLIYCPLRVIFYLPYFGIFRFFDIFWLFFTFLAICRYILSLTHGGIRVVNFTHGLLT